jgi:hypothetical protein
MGAQGNEHDRADRDDPRHCAGAVRDVRWLPQRQGEKIAKAGLKLIAEASLEAKAMAETDHAKLLVR